jgi:hypothetical protein
MYKLGSKRVALFGGTEIWPILDPQGNEICMVNGPKKDAEELLRHLNRHFDHANHKA